MEPQYKDVKGWNSDVSGIEDFEKLPTEAQTFVRKLERISKQGINYIQVNNKEDEGIIRIVR